MSEQKFTFNELVLLRPKRGHEAWDVGHYAYEYNVFIALVGGIKCNKYNYTVIPYKGNEHLLGTTDNPTPKWTPKKGEVVKVRDNENDAWLYRKFDSRNLNGYYICVTDKGILLEWKYCEPLTDEEKGNADR